MNEPCKQAVEAAREIAQLIPSEYVGMHRLGSTTFKKLITPIQAAIDSRAAEQNADLLRENAELQRKATAWEKDFRIIKSAHDLKQVTLEEYGEEIDELQRQVAEKERL